MKILLIQPRIKNNISYIDRLLSRFSIFPPFTLQQIEALTPEKHVVDIVDENRNKIKFSGEYDLVGITCFTSNAFRAYEIADEFRKRNVKVVLGGYHPSALPEEAKQHADAVLIGEAEEIWNQILKDAENDALKNFYIGEPANIDDIPYSKRRNFSLTASVQATRGCPNGCEFCALSKMEGRKYRKRKIEKIIEEISQIKQKAIIFYDASLTIDISFTKELFKKMKELNKKFACFGNANMLKDEEFLEVAREAGCMLWSIGFESISQETIDKLGKRYRVKEYPEIIKKIREHNMAVIGSFIFGFDNDTPSVFKATIEEIQNWELDSAGFSILTPFPGTKLFDRLDKEGRILTKDWSKYTTENVVFIPKNMTPKELEEGVKWICEEYFSPLRTLKRCLNSIYLGIYPFLGNYFWNFSMRRFYRKTMNIQSRSQRIKHSLHKRCMQNV